MCATAVLRSQDCLSKHYGPRRKAANPNYNNTIAFRSRRRKRSPTGVENTGPDRSREVNQDRKSPSPVSDGLSSKSNLVMGQVKILKRGEALPDLNNNIKPDPAPASAPAPTNTTTTATTFKKLGSGGHRNEDELILCSTGRLGPDPETVQMQIRASDFYAGSGPIVSSPPPSSLPLPAFFCKEKRKIDAATNDLLRLLRLDLS